MIHNLYKHRGETPLECIQNFRKKHPEQKEEKWTYLGRLDPMADGVLLAATAEDIKKRDEFLNLDKDYDFTVLFGFSTDSYDILGKIFRVEKIDSVSESTLIRLTKAYEGKREQKYPAFSSKTVNGVALHDLARRGVIDDIEIPTKNVTIKKLEFLGFDTLLPKELLGRSLMDIGKVKGDFRQHDILILWKQMLGGFERQDKIFLGKFKAHVSSGTYIRGIVNDLGNSLGIGACALSITRTKVGEYDIKDSIR